MFRHCLPIAALTLALLPRPAGAQTPVPDSPNLAITAASVTYVADYDMLVFDVTVKGTAGATTPTARGRMDGAPVLGYVFPTTLKSTDVGFSATEGIVALAVTAHPDFDDTPLWDENRDRVYDNDGVVFHTHWVVLEKDARVPGGLAVKHFRQGDPAVVLPATNPGMPMYMDSPGYSVLQQGQTMRVLVPAARLYAAPAFNFDAVAAYMEVRTTGDLPMLGVYKVYSVLSGDLSLPYTVTR